MPEAFLPRLLLPLRLALQGGACPLLPLSGPYHDPAFRALRQIQLLATPPVARAVGAALPAVQRLARLESLLHHGLRGVRPLGARAPVPRPLCSISLSVTPHVVLCSAQV